MKKILDNIRKQSTRWLNNQKKSQSYKDNGSKNYNPFAYGYATGWIKALQAFKGWLAEFGEYGVIETEINRLKELLDKDYAYLGEEEKKCKKEAYDEILSVVTHLQQMQLHSLNYKQIEI